MRNIKVRVWDGKKIWGPIDFKEHLIQPGGCFPEPIILMQFTGLQDTNGRDIYEGDLVTCEPSKIIRKIIFHNGCFKLESAGGLILNNLGSYIEFNNVQIIGNIYETAETAV